MADYDKPEHCTACLGLGIRQLTRTHVMGASDWNTQGWNPALGCYTKSTSEARRIAKSKGMVEIGNENPDKIHDHYDKMRKKKSEDTWQRAADLKE